MKCAIFARLDNFLTMRNFVGGSGQYGEVSKIEERENPTILIKERKICSLQVINI